MSSEDEFIKWLNRPEKTFEENFSFAIKAWKSSEFPLSSKYEKVLEWLSDKVKKIGRKTNDFKEDLMNEFLQLRCPLGLINIDIKRIFMGEMVNWAKSWKSGNDRRPVDVLFTISEMEMMQDLLRTECDVYTAFLGQIFKSYEKYLRETGEILVGAESEYFGKIMATLKSRAKKAGDLNEFEIQFTEFTLQPLVELILVFQDKGIKFFDDLLELEKILLTDYLKQNFFERIRKLPTHVNLLAVECNIVNYRGDALFFQKLIDVIFNKQLGDEMIDNPKLSLTIAAYTLEMFKKHDILLNLPVTEDKNAIQFFKDKIKSLVAKFQDDYLFHVLKLLYATLRLNPLILENTVLEITAKIMLANKDDQEQKMFEEYMILLLDMFKKLSRAESFVSSLNKAIKTLLSSHKFSKKTKKRAASLQQEETSAKKLKLANGLEVNARQNEESNFYLEVLFREFQEQSYSKNSIQSVNSFPHIAFAWPSATVGICFSKLITGLMSKPSLVIWKTLIYSLKELIEATTVLDDNKLFLLDFYTSLLCQYFAGCKLPEQSHKFWDEIEQNRQLTRNVLKNLGHFLLGQEHNNRTMNAFLECCYFTGLFDLLLWYYRPDFMTDDEEFKESSRTLHGYLSEDEWVLIRQRIINFGRVECKFNANRILLQNLKSKMLFHKKKSVHFEKCMLSPIAADFEQAKLVFSNQNEGNWLLPSISSKEKLEMCELLVQELNYNIMDEFKNDLEALEILAFELYKKLGCVFQERKKAILSELDFDSGLESIAKVVVSKKDGYILKKIEMSPVREILEVLKRLPIGYCRKEKKEVFFALQLAFYRDLKAAEEEELAVKAFDVLTDILHFGVQIQVFKNFPINRLIDILPPSSTVEFYESIFSTLRNDIDAAEKFLQSIHEILQENQLELTDDYVKILIMSIDTLSESTNNKRLKKNLPGFLEAYATFVNAYFAEVEGRKAKKDRKFVEKTLSGFIVYANSIMLKLKDAKELDENFRRICKIYIGYSMDCHNEHAIKLITLALTKREILHFDQDEIEFVLNSYWKQLNEDLKAAKQDEKTAQSVIAIIISNKTNEDLLFTLKKIGKEIAREDFGYTCRLLALIAKCPFSTIKGAIFNEHFKLITFNMTMRLEKDDNFQFIDNEIVLSLLDCHKAIAENIQIPMTYDTLDDMLTFLMNVNIKKFPVSDTNVKLFNKLHLALTELCTALIKNRHLILLDRVPQFVHIFKDLLQAICWYKSDRLKDTPLLDEEIDDLTELALKMENLMHIIAKHSLEVKRVAPYVLTFVINLMISNKRPTTLYPKIKTHIENICYDLVAVCDHRVGQFILRCSNDAARQVYEVLVKDYIKYHKFKGKV